MHAITENQLNRSTESSRLYLDLMKRTLTNSIYKDAEYQSIAMTNGIRALVGKVLRALGLDLVRKVNSHLRSEGKDWPMSAHTMIGFKRLDNLQTCVERIIQDHVPGDFIETGVWRGGASIFMKAVLKAHDVADRNVYVCDSFQGLPKPTHDVDKKDPAGEFYKDKQLAVSLEQVQNNFQAYDLLDDHVKFVKGWFCDTLPHLAVSELAIVRLDGDLYQSTMDGLINLYPKLSIGGFLIVDDYAIPACKQAIQDYRQQHDIQEPILEIDWTGVYWRKER